jgi:hypothetical protein
MLASGLHAHKFEFIVTKHSEKQCETLSFRMALMLKPHVRIQTLSSEQRARKSCIASSTFSLEHAHTYHYMMRKTSAAGGAPAFGTLQENGILRVSRLGLAQPGYNKSLGIM